jgi:hypothetical protein
VIQTQVEKITAGTKAEIHLIILKVLALEIKLALILRTAGGGVDTRARMCDKGFIIINRETNKDLMEICPAKCDTVQIPLACKSR